MKVSHSRNEAKASPVVKTVMAFLNTHSSSGTPRSRGRNSTPSPTSESTDVPLKRVSHSRSSSAAWQGGGRHTCFLASATVCLFLLYLTLLDSATHRAVISHTKKIESLTSRRRLETSQVGESKTQILNGGSSLNPLLFENNDDSEPDFLDDPIHKCAERPLVDWPLPNPPYSGYLMIRANGGLNQMRAAICDMVAVARHLNAILILPELDRTSFWSDPSQFGDVFNVSHFIDSLKDEVKILHKLPSKYGDLKLSDIFTMDPVSWSNLEYYTKVIKPLLRKHKIIRLYQTESRLANNPPAVSSSLQKLRCRVQYHSLQFSKPIKKVGERLINRLRRKGPYIALHLRYEMDMLSFTGCSHGCTLNETLRLTRLRYHTARWREKKIDGEKRHQMGDCPLTPEEVALFLRAMGYKNETQIYIASGKIFGGKKRLSRLLSVFPNTVRKEMMLTESELVPFRKHSTKLAALDYMATVAADVFMSTFSGNMARLVEGHRRYLGHRKTISPDRKKFVELVELYRNKTLTWKEFSKQVIDSHKDRIGSPRLRVQIPGKPKEEDNFFQNPQECMCLDETLASENKHKVSFHAGEEISDGQIELSIHSEKNDEDNSDVILH